MIFPNTFVFAIGFTHVYIQGAAKKSPRSAPPRRPKISEFVSTPKVVPLPVYPIRDIPQSFDYDNVVGIRKRVCISVLQC